MTLTPTVPPRGMIRRNSSPRHVLAEIGRTRPLSVVMAQKVKALRQWVAGRTVKADQGRSPTPFISGLTRARRELAR